MRRRYGYRWVVLAVGTAAQATTAAYFLGLAAITPALRDHFGLGLAGVGALVGSVSVGLVATLILWGGVTDRYASAASWQQGSWVPRWRCGPRPRSPTRSRRGRCSHWPGPVVRASTRRAGGPCSPGSRRATAGWRWRSARRPCRSGWRWPPSRSPPSSPDRGVAGVFRTLAVCCLVAALAVAIWVCEPPDQPARSASTRAGFATVVADPRLLRLALTGFLLVVPQYLGTTFLVEVLHDGAGMSLAVAGTLLAVTQVLGGVGRLGTGMWSDRVGSRLGPLRVVAVAVAVGFALAAALEPGPAVLLAVVLVPAAALALSWNGLVFTAAGELAPPGRAATAMAVSNTACFVAAATAPAVGGLVAQFAGWPAMLAMGAAAAIAALVTLAGIARAQQDRSRAATPAQNS